MMIMNIRIETLTIDDADIVFDWVLRLLRELGEEGEELGELDRERVLSAWKQRLDQYQVLVAKDREWRDCGCAHTLYGLRDLRKWGIRCDR